MKTKNLFFGALILLGVCLFLNACKKDDPPPAVKKAIPTSSTNINIPNRTIGELKLFSEGRDGYTYDGQLLTNFGYTIVPSEPGGVDHTYAVVKDGVKLRWAENVFIGFDLETGWVGQTEQGVKLGDSVSAVLAKYPNLSLIPPYNSRYQLPTGSDNVEVIFYFDEAPTPWELYAITVNKKL